MNEADRQRIRKKSAIVSLLVGFAMLTGKMGAYFLTNSAAIFSDALESVIHIGATAMVLFAIIMAAKPADRNHLYGHGNIEFFSAGIEGLLIVLAAIAIIAAALNDLINGIELKELNIGVTVVAAAGVINTFLGLYLIKNGKKTESLTLIADGKHILTDSITSLGVIVGIILVLITDIKELDPIFAILVAINIIFTGYKLVRISVGGLMKEADPATLEKISTALRKNRKPVWIDIHELRYWQSGDKTFVDFHLILPYYFNVRESHREEKALEDVLEEQFLSCRVTMHLDACKPAHCRFCAHEECEVRGESQQEILKWDVLKITGEPLHKYRSAPDKKD